MDRVLKRCLEKDSARRLRDIADVRLELEDRALFPISSTDTGESSRARWVLASSPFVPAGPAEDGAVAGGDEPGLGGEPTGVFWPVRSPIEPELEHVALFASAALAGR